MIVQCPDCGWSADVPDDKIPAGCVKGTCPKCKMKFDVFKQELVFTFEQSNEPENINTEKNMTTGLLSNGNKNVWICVCGKKVAASIENCPYCKTARSEKEKAALKEVPITLIETNGEYNIRKYKRELSIGDRASTGCAMSILFLVGGGLATLIPIIGIIIGPLIVFNGVIGPIVGLSKKYKYEYFTAIDGPCPYCAANIVHQTELFESRSAFYCPICTETIKLEFKQFFRFGA